MNLDDMKQYCGRDPNYDYLHAPFSQGEFTYATDGSIMVRVPKIDAAGPCRRSKPLNVDGPLKGIESAKFTPINVSMPPKAEDNIVCPDCEGRGRMHECRDCTCTCRTCNETGTVSSEARTSTEVSGVLFSLGYLRKVVELPNVRVCVQQGDGKPMLFQFDGGIGALMPLRGQYETHVDTRRLTAVTSTNRAGSAEP